jgi:hypothetical protein
MPLSQDDRITALERCMSRLERRFGEPRYRDKRDGRAVLSVRVGDEVVALVRRAARERGCTIADLLRPAIISAVSQPSTDHLSEIKPTAGLHMRPRTIAETGPPATERARQALSGNLAEQARLAAADAAVSAGCQPRQAHDAAGLFTERGTFRYLTRP